MKEFNFKLDDNLFKGLRKFSNNPRESNALVECHNLAPSEEGFDLHKYIVSMNEVADYG